MDKIIAPLIAIAIVVTLIGAAVVFRGPSVPRTQVVITPGSAGNYQSGEEPIPILQRPRATVSSEPEEVTAPSALTQSAPKATSIPAPTPNIPNPKIVVITATASSTQLISLATSTKLTNTPGVSAPAPVPAPAPASTGASQSTTWWHPNLNTKFQIQFAVAFNTTTDINDADAFDLDLFDTPKETITTLKARGKHVICYMSAGSWEDWRPDSATFPKSIIGKDYEGWPGENWLDIRRIDLLGPIMQARFDLAKSKGCDAVDPDNMDVYNVDSGFPLTYSQQVTYNKWLADEAHKRGLSIGLKNDSDQIPDLLSSFDWTILENCHSQGWCAQVKPFITAGKAVFQIEYTEDNAKLADFCPESKQLQFSAVLKNRNLDAWVARCP